MRYIVLLFILLSLIGCDGDYLDTSIEPLLVVEGEISTGKPAVVMLTTSLQPSTKKQSKDSLYSHVLRWARVEVSDGECSEVLTGRYDKRYFPPFIYTGMNVIGESGKTYTLTVSQENMRATAVTTIPPSVNISHIEQEAVEGNDTVMMLYAQFTKPEGEHYYVMMYSDDLGQFLTSYLGVFSNNNINNPVRYPIYNTHNLLKTENSMFFDKGDTIRVRLATVDKASYDFWSDFQDSRSQSGNFFTPYTQNLRSNINGGKGYWCGYGISERTVIVGIR